MLFNLLGMAESLVTYEPGSSYLHRLHPLSKLALMGFVIVGGMYISGPTFPWWLNFALFALLVIIAVTGRMPLKKEMQLRGGYIFAIVSILFIGNLIFSRGVEVLNKPNVKVYFTIPPFIYATSAGLNFAISKTLLILSSIVVVIILLKSTRLSDLSHALTQIGVPYSVATILATSFRCIPMVIDGLLIVYNAERARGLELDKGSRRERIRQWQLLMTPLLIVLLKWVDQMTIVFQSRGLDFSKRARTRLREVPFRPVDALIILALVVFLGGFIAANQLGFIHANIY